MRIKFIIALFVSLTIQSIHAINLQNQLSSLKQELESLNSQLKKISKAAKQAQESPPSSIWAQLAQGKVLSRTEKLNIFVQDCAKLEKENAKIPSKTPSKLRIASYNVHYWADPNNNNNFDQIFTVIEKINADILILQEVSWGPTSFNNYLTVDSLVKKFNALEYQFNSFCEGANVWGAPFGNVIFSRYKFLTDTQQVYKNNELSAGEKRCFVNVKIELPNKKIISLYGTHLDVFDQSGVIRYKQMQELLEVIQKDSTRNIVIAGDFNEVRKRDYQYKISNKLVWDLLVADNKLREDSTPTKALELLGKNRFNDCFSRAKLTRPKFTVWTGTVVDFIFLNRTWNIPIAGCYVYYSSTSDHLPIIMDLSRL